MVDTIPLELDFSKAVFLPISPQPSHFKSGYMEYLMLQAYKEIENDRSKREPLDTQPKRP